MKELVNPFVQTWGWVTTNGGLPGQILFSCLAIVVVLGLGLWISNRRIG